MIETLIGSNKILFGKYCFNELFRQDFYLQLVACQIMPLFSREKNDTLIYFDMIGSSNDNLSKKAGIVQRNGNARYSNTLARFCLVT